MLVVRNVYKIADLCINVLVLAERLIASFLVALSEVRYAD